MKSEMEHLDTKKLHLGLSKYETRAYVSLVMEGTCEARKLSMKCGVPRTKIYFTLNKLKERGLVYELPGEPRRFAATSPIGAFDQYLSHLREEVSSKVISLVRSRELVSFLEQEYAETRSIIGLKKEEVWIVLDHSEIVKKIRELLSQAKRDVTLITTEEDFIFFYKTFEKTLDDLVKAGVSVRIGTKVNSRNKYLAQELRYMCKVKDVDFCLPILYLCVDDQASLLAKLSHNNPSVKDEENLAVFWNNASLSCLLSSLFPRLS